MSPAYRRPHSIAPRTENRYCASCSKTQRFLDHGARLSCPVCARELERVGTARIHTAGVEEVRAVLAS